jgi:hypothetical protein
MQRYNMGILQVQHPHLETLIVDVAISAMGR